MVASFQTNEVHACWVLRRGSDEPVHAFVDPDIETESDSSDELLEFPLVEVLPRPWHGQVS